MNYEPEVIDFLARHENLPFVLEIESRAGKVREKLYRDFWECFEGKVRAQLADHALHTRWTVKRDQALPGSWGGVSLIPLEEPRILYLRPRLEQGSGNFRLFYGIHWSTENLAPLTLPAVCQLASRLQNDAYTRSDLWWLGSKFTEIYLGRNDFLIRMATNVDIVADDVAQSFCDLLEKHIELVEQANQAISDAAEHGLPYP